MTDRDVLLIKAKVAEQIGRHADVVYAIETIIQQSGGALTFEERNLYAAANCKLISELRQGWTRLEEMILKAQSSMAFTSSSTLSETLINQKSMSFEQGKSLLSVMGPYKEALEMRMTLECRKVVRVVETCLLPASNCDFAVRLQNIVNTCGSIREKGFKSVEAFVAAKLELPEDLDDISAENLVFYLKMLGDYRRYVAELQIDDDKRDKAAQPVLALYSAADLVAKSQLRPNHPARLGLALNCSVFFYEVLKQPDRACDLVKAAYDEAAGELDSSPGDKFFEDSQAIMHMIRKYLKQWTSLD